MICKECKNLGQRSKVYSGDTSSTLMSGGKNYWDEDGKYHMHGVNTFTTIYHCSNGHKWVENYIPECPERDYGGPV